MGELHKKFSKMCNLKVLKLKFALFQSEYIINDLDFSEFLSDMENLEALKITYPEYHSSDYTKKHLK
jgi:hypothetical protein